MVKKSDLINQIENYIAYDIQPTIIQVPAIIDLFEHPSEMGKKFLLTIFQKNEIKSLEKMFKSKQYHEQDHEL